MDHINCRACDGPVQRNLQVCPHCGCFYPNRATRRQLVILAAVMGTLVLLAAIVKLLLVIFR